MKEQKRSKDFDKMILEAIQEKFSFFAWQSIGGNVEKCEMKIKAYRKEYNEIELDVSPDQVEALAMVISGSRILNIYVPELSVSFTSELKAVISGTKVKLCAPEDYVFFERRRHERVQPAKTCFVSFEHNNGIVKKSIYDFSLGGIAIVLPRSDKITVWTGKIFPALILEIGGQKIKVKAECVSTVVIDRYKVENLPYGGVKLSFRFTGISKEDKIFLIEFITHQLLLQQVQKKAN